MSFNPIKFLNVARDLNSIAKSEESSRSVVSRAYYGAFGHLVTKLHFNSYGTSVHQDLITSFLESGDRKRKILGKKLEGLFKKRKHADYKYHEEFKENCQYCINEADNIINLFNNLDQENL